MSETVQFVCGFAPPAASYGSALATWYAGPPLAVMPPLDAENSARIGCPASVRTWFAVSWIAFVVLAASLTTPR